ncbi:MAG: hypothetical protein ACI9S8_002404 [Chlamydiales bacterium]|jgi:hypothetical protein
MASGAVASASSGLSSLKGVPNLGAIAKKKAMERTVGKRFDVNDRINLSQKAAVPARI